jgi:hypothetical protein
MIEDTLVSAHKSYAIVVAVRVAPPRTPRGPLLTVWLCVHARVRPSRRGT